MGAIVLLYLIGEVTLLLSPGQHGREQVEFAFRPLDDDAALGDVFEAEQAAPTGSA